MGVDEHHAKDRKEPNVSVKLFLLHQGICFCHHLSEVRVGRVHICQIVHSKPVDMPVLQYHCQGNSEPPPSGSYRLQHFRFWDVEGAAGIFLRQLISRISKCILEHLEILLLKVVNTMCKLQGIDAVNTSKSIKFGAGSCNHKL